MSIQTKNYTSKKTKKTTTKYYACVFDSISNQPVWSKGFNSRADAVIEESLMIKQLRKGERLAKSNKTFREVMNLWLESSKNDYADSTFKTYESWCKRYLDGVFGDQKIDKITGEHIVKFKSLCLSNPRNYSAETVNKLINILCNIFNFALKTLKIISSSPMDGISRCKVEIKDHVTWSESQINYFLQLSSVILSPYYTMLVLSFATGARPGEICGLHESSLSENGILKIQHGLSREGVLTDLKNKRSHRPLKITPALYQLLESQKRYKSKLRLKRIEYEIEDKKAENSFLFVTEQGHPVTPSLLSKNFKKLVKQNNTEVLERTAAGENLSDQLQLLPDMRLYDTRHSFATNLMIKGKKSKLIAEVMGNSVKTMELHYAHLSESLHDNILEEYGNDIIPFSKAL